MRKYLAQNPGIDYCQSLTLKASFRSCIGCYAHNIGLFIHPQLRNFLYLELNYH